MIYQVLYNKRPPHPVPASRPLHKTIQIFALLLCTWCLCDTKPPLQFYLQVIRDQEWDRVDVVTYAADETSLNPVIPALQSMQAKGELPGNLHIHTVSTTYIYISISINYN